MAATTTTKTLANQLASYVLPFSFSLPSTMLNGLRALCRDQTNSALVSTVNQGLSDASSGIKDIAAALFTGQQAPAASRNQVADGLTSAVDAANSITS